MSDDIVERLRRCGCCDSFEAADEIERLRGGGCARDQRTTQFCAEAVELQREIERLRDDVAHYRRWLNGEMTIRISQADWIEMGATELTDPSVRVIRLRDLYRAQSDLRGREEPDDGDHGDED